MQGDFDIALSQDWQLGLNGTFSWTPSINEGEPRTPADKSVGKQLPYVPEFSSTVTGRLTWSGGRASRRRCSSPDSGFVWGDWTLLYKWCYYSKRFTMSSNDISLTGKLPAYFMSNLTLEKGLSFKVVDLSLKGSINNLFNEEYLSVLSRPMPGINYEIFIGITPKWGKKKILQIK